MKKIIKNNLGNFLVICLVFLMMTGWFFSGWPQILKEPRIPPEIQEAKAQTGPQSAFLDGGSVSIGTTETTIGSLSTTLPAGTNLIIVVFQFDGTPAGADITIAVGGLKLKRAGTTLASNAYLLRARGGTAGRRAVSYMLVHRETGVSASPTYEVTAQASAVNSVGEVKMVVVNEAPNSGFTEGSSTAIRPSGTTLLSTTHTLPAGDNLVIASVELENGSGADRTIAAGALKLMRGVTTLASNQNIILVERKSEMRAHGILLLAKDTGASENPTYDIKAAASEDGINGKVRLLTISGLSSALLDTDNVAIGTNETTIGTLDTTFSAGENVVISSIEIDNTAAATRTISTGNMRLKYGGTTQSSNERDFELPATGVADFRNHGLLWRQADSSVNPSYTITALASATGINGETKTIAIHMQDATVTVGTVGTQVSTMTIPSSDQYVGGAFSFVRNIGSANVTSITITETGTVNANLNLSNLKLYYETAATCSYDGTETLFGTAASFNASEKATVSGTMSVGTSQVCLYLVLDVGSGASNGQTLDLEISNPLTEVTVSSGTVSPATPVAIAGTTTLSTANTAPVITLGTIAQETDGSKWVRINYTGTDAENDLCSLVNYEYSQDNTNWFTMTEKSGVGSNGTTNLPFTSGGASLMFAWDVGTDLPNTADSTVYIRLKPNDGTVDGNVQTSSAFAIDTKHPTISQAVHLEATPQSADTSFQIDVAFTEDNPNINEFDYDLNGVGYLGWTAGESNVEDPSPKTFNVSLDGDDWFNGIKARHIDDFGNSVISEDTNDVYVVPLVPNAPTVTNTGISTFNVIVNKNPSEVGNVKYAIQVTSTDPNWNNKWVSASYTPSATPVWRTYSAWGGASGFNISGLMSVQYCFQVKASNPSDATNSTLSGFSGETCQTVNPYLSFGLSAGSTGFGSLSPSFISTSTPNIVLTVTTNAKDGYEIKVKDDGNQIDTPGLYDLEDNYLIPSFTTTLVVGTEGYGIQASSATATVASLYLKTGNDVGGLLRTFVLLASNTGPVTSESTTVVHKTAVSVLTAAGNYTDAITYTCTANY